MPSAAPAPPPWEPVGAGAFALPPLPAPSAAALRWHGLAWLLGTLLWARCTLVPLLLAPLRLPSGQPLPLSLPLRLALATAASLLLAWALWLLLALHGARARGLPRFL
jgi:hypothetical protein